MAARRPPAEPRLSARLRLALSYAVFLVAAGIVALFGVYIVLRYVPDYPLTAPNLRDAPVMRANPREPDSGSVASRQEILNAVIGMSAIILAGLAVIGVTGGWILAGWVLRPLQRINEAAQIAGTGRLDHRIRLSGRNDEFRQLADTFDQMLDRLQDAFTAQERFAANASHELRTPLTVIETLLEVARANPDGQDYRMLVERLSQTNARAIGLTQALLRLADTNAITAAFEPVDLAEITRSVLAESAGEADRYDVTVMTRLDAAPTVGDAALLAQLATNLIQNAIRHNQLFGTAFVLTWHDVDRSTISLRVENTGAAYTPEAAARLREPFLRGDGRVQRNGKQRSYGLGLALVSRIVDVHGGMLSIVPRAGGGLIVTATLRDRASTRPARPSSSHPAPARRNGANRQPLPRRAARR